MFKSNAKRNKVYVVLITGLEYYNSAASNVTLTQHIIYITFTTIQARPLYEAYVLGSVSVLTRCNCSVFNVHTPVLKALRLGAVTRKAGKAFHCSRVLGKKLYEDMFSSLEELEMS